MPISQARMAEGNCTGYGVATPRLTWLAVDAVERPDLVEQVSELLEFECPSWCRPFRRPRSLLVLRVASHRGSRRWPPNGGPSQLSQLPPPGGTLPVRQSPYKSSTNN